jgi:hypothetical protein
MELIWLDLILPYAADLLGSAAAAATLLTFAQKRMWPMRISAIAANLFFIGYGALGQLYPVLFLHLLLLPLNVVRLVQLAQQTTRHQTADPEPPRPILLPLQLARSCPPVGLGGKPSPAGARGARLSVWDLIRPAPP